MDIKNIVLIVLCRNVVSLRVKETLRFMMLLIAMVPLFASAVVTLIDDTYIADINQSLIVVPPSEGVLSNDLVGSSQVTDFGVQGGSLVAPGTPVATSLGSLTMNADGSFTYQPNFSSNLGTDFFEYTVDGITATLLIEVYDATVISGVALGPDGYAVAEQSQTSETFGRSVLLNDQSQLLLDVESIKHGTQSTYSSVSSGPVQGSFGELGVTSDGFVTYTPNNLNQVAVSGDTDFFDYQVLVEGFPYTGSIEIVFGEDPLGGLPDVYQIDSIEPTTIAAPGGVLSNDINSGADPSVYEFYVINQFNSEAPINPFPAGDFVSGTYGDVQLNQDGSFTYNPYISGGPETGDTETIYYSTIDLFAGISASYTPITLEFVDVTTDSDNDGLTDFEENNGNPATDPNLQDTDGDGLNDFDEVNGPTDPTVADTDGDGLNDFDEVNGPTDPTVADTDGDGLNDLDEVNGVTDPTVADTDGDGLNDLDEVNGVTDPIVADTDGDGLNDLDEVNGPTDPTVADTDGDGLNDLEEVNGVTDPIVADTDGDGLNDGEENNLGSNPTVADTDGDGLSDGVEVNVQGSNPFNSDTDGDGLGDGFEVNDLGSNPTSSDTDGDGLNDGEENNLGSNPTVADSDGDGLGDGFEVNDLGSNPTSSDTDGDGLNDGEENNLGSNPTVADTDGDGLGDGAEVNDLFTSPTNFDSDGDGLGDGFEVNDLGSNPTSSDTDGDGLGDGVEVNEQGTSPTNVDSDGDGLSDGVEVNEQGSNPTNFDTDSDGLGDGFEVNDLGSNPTSSDSDGDGLSDGVEVNEQGTSPTNVDSDSDGLGDGFEVNDLGSNPTSSDTDGDGLSDGVEVNERGTSPTNVDSDGDSLSDGVEVNDLGTSPTNFDSDGDGLDDGYEVNDYPSDPTVFDTDGDGLSDGVENNLGSNPTVADSDGDGLSDGDEVNHFGTSPTQTDSDFDGLSDYAEVNGQGFTSEDDANINGFLSDPNKVDSDYDGVFDAHEAELGTNPSNSDTDGDGLTDSDELLYQLDPLNPDVDGDGLPDGAEISAGSNPNVFDTDGDGLNDRQEVIEFGTNPLEADSDFDGVTDDFEVFNSGTDPLTPNPDEDADNDGVRNADDAFPENGGESGDLDGDGVGNNQDDDIDGDGVLNGNDAYALDASRRGDSDQNGLDDTWELQYFNGLGVAKDFDEEGDGLNNLQEYLSGTHPFEPNISQVLLRERDIPLNHAGRSGSVGLGYEVRNEDGLSTNAGAFLPGLNLRVHFNSAEVDSFVIDTSNALYTYGLFGINNVWTVDDENLDGDFATTHYVTITWLDIYGDWPQAYVLEQDTAELLRLNFVTRAGLHEEAVPSVTIKFSPVDMAEGVGLDTRNGDGFNLSHADISVPLLTRGPLDIDADGEVKTFTDGLLIVRRIFLQNPNGADSRFIGANGSFQNLSDVDARLNLRFDLPSLLDIDGDGSISGPTDGILLLRRMLGFEGDQLTINAVGGQATRSNPSDIADYIDSLMEDLPEAPELAQ